MNEHQITFKTSSVKLVNFQPHQPLI